jgi:hypothetical protein
MACGVLRTRTLTTLSALVLVLGAAGCGPTGPARANAKAERADPRQAHIEATARHVLRCFAAAGYDVHSLLEAEDLLAHAASTRLPGRHRSPDAAFGRCLTRYPMPTSPAGALLAVEGRRLR